MDKKRNMYRNFMANSEGNRRVGRLRLDCKDNIKIDQEESMGLYELD
jgi:hypothetical protein